MGIVQVNRLPEYLQTLIFIIILERPNNGKLAPLQSDYWDDLVDNQCLIGYLNTVTVIWWGSIGA